MKLGHGLKAVSFQLNTYMVNSVRTLHCAVVNRERHTKLSQQLEACQGLLAMASCPGTPKASQSQSNMETPLNPTKSWAPRHLTAAAATLRPGTPDADAGSNGGSSGDTQFPSFTNSGGWGGFISVCIRIDLKTEALFRC